VSATAQPWPPALAGTPAAAVIDRAIQRRRLGHSLLLHGDDFATLLAGAYAIADRLLNPGDAPASVRRSAAGGAHPDCFELRPAGKARQISADATRELIGRLQVTPSIASMKVAILHEADRMNLQAANIFLKTLEEPPPNTAILLLTSRPYSLLSTIRSRCLHFRFPSAAQAAGLEGWPEWLEDYRAWLGRLLKGPPPDKRGVADHVFSVYGLLARFGFILDKAAAEAWARQKESLPPGLEDNEEVAMEVGLANGIRTQLFGEIERATRTFALPHLAAGSGPASRALVAAIEKLESDFGLLRVNLNESAALEDFLLSSLRIWSRRGQ
jgi:DNA polymerase-3 subunit delta'